MNEFLSQEEFNKRVDAAFYAAGVYEDVKHTGNSNRWLKKTKPEIEAKIKEQEEENNKKRKSLYETAKANYNTNVFTPVISSKSQSNNQQNSQPTQAQTQPSPAPAPAPAPTSSNLSNSSNTVNYNNIVAGLPPHLLNVLNNNNKTK
jgi:hypothetical protein